MSHDPSQAPSLLETWYWLSQIFLAMVVLVTAFIARQQLDLIAKQSRATLLLDLDKRWEGAELTCAREVFFKVQEEVKKKIELEGGDKAKDESIEVTRQNHQVAFANHFDHMRKENQKDYQHIMNIWGFLETLGYLYTSKYLSAGEIDKLLGYTIQ
ncbi:MAG: hypothetical protein O2944_04935 [Proteobacteria bacterium]|nr:hypothetical protein [Pseudomonadota bacterium]